MPFHLDQRLPDAAVALPPGTPATTFAPGLPAGDLWTRLGELYEPVAAAVGADLRAGAVSTVVSGDCLVASAVVAGVQRAGLAPAVVWFDAHGDVHTEETSTSGYPGGLALRLLLRETALSRRLGSRPLAESRAVLAGARDLDPAEADYLATAGIRRAAVAEVEAPPGPLVVHVDIDVIDGAEVPGLMLPVAGGPPATDVFDTIRRLAAAGNVVAFSFALTWGAEAGHADTRARFVEELLAARDPS